MPPHVSTGQTGLAMQSRLPVKGRHVLVVRVLCHLAPPMQKTDMQITLSMPMPAHQHDPAQHHHHCCCQHVQHGSWPVKGKSRFAGHAQQLSHAFHVMLWNKSSSKLHHMQCIAPTMKLIQDIGSTFWYNTCRHLLHSRCCTAGAQQGVFMFH